MKERLPARRLLRDGGFVGDHGVDGGNAEKREEVQKHLLEVTIISRATKKQVRRELHRATCGHAGVLFGLGTASVADDP